MTDTSKEALEHALYLLEWGDENDALEDLRSFVKAQADQIDAQAATIKALVEALEAIDTDLEGRNFLESSSLRDKTRAAIAAAKETT